MLKAKKRPRFNKVCFVDSHYKGNKIFTAAVLTENEKVKEISKCESFCRFPYYPGLFYLREGPNSVQAVRMLKSKPDIVCFDAHGIAHPRKAGLASICGAILDIPSIGIAKSLLYGEVKHEGKIGKIVVGKSTIGFVTTKGKQRFYWTPGYGIDTKWLMKFIEQKGDFSILMMELADNEARSHAIS